jgi:hypothetical protein
MLIIKMIKIFSLLAFGFASQTFSSSDWNYKMGGANWPETVAQCDGNSQSPINLPMNIFGDNYSKTKVVKGMKWATTFRDIKGKHFEPIGSPPHTYQLKGISDSGLLTF